MKRGVMWSLAAAVAGALGALLVTPELIRTVGVAEFGLYILILSIGSHAAPFDLGLPWAATRFFADDLARGRADALASRYQATSIVLLGVAVAAGAAAIALIPWIGGLAGAQRPGALRPLMATASASIVVGFRVSLLQSLLRAAQRFDEVGRIALITAVLTPLGLYVGVRARADVATLVAANLAVNLIALALLRIAAARHVPIALRSVAWQPDRVREMAVFSGWSSVGGFVTAVMLQIDRICVALLGSVSGLAYYAVPAQVASRVNLLGSVSTNVFFSRAGWLLAQGRRDELTRQHAAARRILVWLTLAVAVPLGTFGPTFLDVWIGPDMRAAGGSILVALVVGHAIVGVTSIDAALLEGCGRPDLTTKTMLGWALFATAGGALAYPWLHADAIAGAVALWLGGVGTTTAWLARSVLGRSADGSVGRIATAAGGAVALGLTFEAAIGPLLGGLAGTIAGMVFCAAAILLYGFFTVLTRQDRGDLLAPAVLRRVRFAPAAARRFVA